MQPLHDASVTDLVLKAGVLQNRLLDGLLGLLWTAAGPCCLCFLRIRVCIRRGCATGLRAGRACCVGAGCFLLLGAGFSPPLGAAAVGWRRCICTDCLPQLVTLWPQKPGILPHASSLHGTHLLKLDFVRAKLLLAAPLVQHQAPVLHRILSGCCFGCVEVCIAEI